MSLVPDQNRSRQAPAQEVPSPDEPGGNARSLDRPTPPDHDGHHAQPHHPLPTGPGNTHRGLGEAGQPAEDTVPILKRVLRTTCTMGFLE